jgi:predicted regulator of Ras-like GTPase activity (Roadblock/LC7/MglB family)
VTNPIGGAVAAPAPRNPQEFAFLVQHFADATAGVRHALIVSSDGLPVIAAAGLVPDVADPLSAMASGLMSLGESIARLIGATNCEQVMTKFPGAGYLLFMKMSELAGLVVLVEEGANLSVVAFGMTRLVDSVGHVLTPQMRDGLRKLSNGATGR